MEKKGNMSQMKEQNKAPEEQLNKMEKSNLPYPELKTLANKLVNKVAQ